MKTRASEKKSHASDEEQKSTSSRQCPFRPIPVSISVLPSRNPRDPKVNARLRQRNADGGHRSGGRLESALFHQSDHLTGAERHFTDQSMSPQRLCSRRRKLLSGRRHRTVSSVLGSPTVGSKWTWEILSAGLPLGTSLCTPAIIYEAQ